LLTNDGLPSLALDPPKDINQPFDIYDGTLRDLVEGNAALMIKETIPLIHLNVRVATRHRLYFGWMWTKADLYFKD